MALPDSVSIKLVSDEAGTLSITPVVVQDMPLSELVDLLMAQSGKDVARMAAALRRGSLVQGASRYRWQGFEAAPDELAPLLEDYPDPKPERQFDGKSCRFVAFHFGNGGSVELERKPLMKRRILRRRSFWDELGSIAAKRGPDYAEYSYREKADRYRLDLKPDEANSVREAARLLTFGNLARRLETTPVAAVDFYCVRS